ncbi:MAG: DUF1385 domain-containing protein [Deltaproteobacteria bacterium]|nr:DUF1385 domain-containing protein [Deltaproteobacteria bacterium]MBW1951922.1 DUF1385 domain-containing protein [Deltaproteobacteria bacterium]MBW1986330.1 DUF1385 domain-containing protein [Deltaproteobacteria bacterium]MBW2134372.1 DUF1385 domain-containing protein [Deltaproteobacteria bacterium]
MPDFPVGGQAVIEGVMMRAPHMMTIAVRKPDGSIIVRADRLKLLGDRLPWLRWPFLRGPIVLWESLLYGLQALTFSAQAAVEEDEEQLGSGALILTVIAAFALALFFFGLLPHYLSGLIGRLWGEELSTDTLAFHVIDGLLKIGFFLLYVWSISLFQEVRRVFEYHGAEHKSIFTYEAGQALTLENARQHQIMHPRCGTSFILVVLLLSIFLFAALFPLVPGLSGWGRWLDLLLQVGLKIILMIPIAALSYEVIRFGGRHADHPLMRLVLWPGLMTQHLTAREPADDQLEVALAALRAAIHGEQEVLQTPG